MTGTGTAARYVFTDLGTFGGGTWSVATAINNKGQIVGQADTGGVVPFWGDDARNLRPNKRDEAKVRWYLPDARAVLWDGLNRRFLEPRGDFAFSIARDINGEGQIVGGTEIPAASMPPPPGGVRGIVRPFVWHKGKLKRLPTFDAYAINDRGEVLTAFGYGVRLWRNGRQIELGRMSGYAISIPRCVNNRNQVAAVVSAQYGGGHGRLAVWDNGRWEDLGNLGGQSIQLGGMNDVGQIVGWWGSEKGIARAYLWQNGRFTGLGTLGGLHSGAHGINNRGQIVGQAGLRSGYRYPHAALWENGAIFDLNDLIAPTPDWVLVSATAINDRGQIVGNGRYKGRVRAFLLTPIAEFAAENVGQSPRGRR